MVATFENSWWGIVIFATPGLMDSTGKHGGEAISGY
jgi:hypothetical protein